MMDVNNLNWTPKAKRAWDLAVQLAKAKNHSSVNCCHLFCVFWLHSNESFHAFTISRGIHLNPKRLQALFDKYINQNNDLFFDEKFVKKSNEYVEKALEEARKIAEKKDNFFVGTEHIIYGILESDKEFSNFLFEKDIDTEHLKLCIECFIAGEVIHGNHFEVDEDDDDEYDDDEEDDEEDDEDAREEESSAFLEKYCVLLNDEVQKPNFGKISGRDKEIALIEEILCRKVKSNCVLVGEAGTGKTTIVEGLAQLIENEKYDGPLFNRKIYSLDLACLLAGTKYRGQLEKRFNNIIKKFKGRPDRILFIDEIHSIIGSGSKEGSQDLANMLKPILARGEIKCIGATTSSEYKKYFEKDAALSRRFQSVDVDEPNVERVIEMVTKALPSYESHHKVKFEENFVNLAVKMCETYLPNQRFPDKAFDVIDQSASKFRIRYKKTKKKVSEKELCEVIADKIKVDVKIVQDKSHNTFANFESNIKKEIFGQDENISKIYDVLACSKVGMRSKDKPIASFFFVGPTSVGKTFTAKEIAKEFYGNEKSFLQLNMSEYQEQTSISKLIGANAGYVGYEEGGILTEFVRQNPNALILFDEAEKCNPSVLHLLLQILDEAKLTDNLNRTIDFSRSIIVLTSNIGSQEAQKVSMGFVSETNDTSSEYESSVKKKLPPELVARIDEIVVFKNLEKDAILNIFKSKLKDLQSSMNNKGIKLKINKNIDGLILNDDKIHARKVKQLLRQQIEVPLAKFIVSNPEKQQISIKMIDKNLIIC